ncbi:MAG: 3-methyl-2-oxobutanoate hydroxymethyltransferase [Rhodospirillales bacterium]
MSRKTVRAIRAMKGKGIVSLTAYTAPVARMVDDACDFVLVGDSLGQVLYDYPSTIHVDLDMMIRHGDVVARTCRQACVVVDMPFGYQESPEVAFRMAARLMRETACDAIKLEGGVEMADTIRLLVRSGLPVLAHIGLMPQHAAQTGYRKVTSEQGEQVLADARAVAGAGAFAVVLECVDPDLSRRVTAEIDIPTIGIGSGSDCDGQILVTEDLLGLTGSPPSFAKPLTDLVTPSRKAIATYAERTRNGR